MKRSSPPTEMDRLCQEVEILKGINAFLKQSFAAHDPVELLEKALNLFPHFSFLGAMDRGAAFLVDEERRELILTAQRNMPEEQKSLCARVPFGHCLCGKAAMRGTILFSSRIDHDHEIVYPGMKPHGHYNVPIRVDDRIEGVFVLYVHDGAESDRECFHFLEAIACVTAGALKRMALDRRMRRGCMMWHMVVENTPCGILTVDKKGVVRLFNATAEKMFGYRKEEIVGREAIELVPVPLRTFSEDVVRCCSMAENLQLIGQIPFDLEGLRQNGEVFPIRLAFSRMDGEEGSMFIAMVVDMSEEKRLFEEVVQLERTIIESAPFGIIVTDDQENIRVFNAAAEELFGYRREEIVGREVGSLIQDGMRLRRQGEVVDVLEKGGDRFSGRRVFEAEGKGKDGSVFPIRLAVNPMVMEGRPSYVRMIADISEEKRLYSELVQSERMAGLGGMVAGVAHEINTPVGIGVTASSELEDRTLEFERMLQREGVSEEELKEYLASTTRLARLIRVNLERAADLVRSFKAVAVDQSSEKPRLFKVREYVESSVLTLHHHLKNSKLTVFVICDDSLEVRSHPGAFSQIVINLVNNSRIHAFDPDRPGRITMEISSVEKRLHFIYRDDGKGMDEETRNRIFEPFFTTRRDLGGSGLGMHIVYNLVTQTLGGTIVCQSSPGKGMSVHMDIPLPEP
ncbi:MAG: PAS domain S-box protein [Magnetococcales bacterium]|nr:PAS domain S-box protein [Magnetococcales bacterium]